MTCADVWFVCCETRVGITRIGTRRSTRFSAQINQKSGPTCSTVLVSTAPSVRSMDSRLLCDTMDLQQQYDEACDLLKDVNRLMTSGSLSEATAKEVEAKIHREMARLQRLQMGAPPEETVGAAMPPHVARARTTVSVNCGATSASGNAPVTVTDDSSAVGGDAGGNSSKSPVVSHSNSDAPPAAGPTRRKRKAAELCAITRGGHVVPRYKQARITDFGLSRARVSKNGSRIERFATGAAPSQVGTPHEVFECPVATCGRVFATRAGWQSHIRSGNAMHLAAIAILREQKGAEFDTYWRRHGVCRMPGSTEASQVMSESQVDSQPARASKPRLQPRRSLVGAGLDNAEEKKQDQRRHNKGSHKRKSYSALKKMAMIRMSDKSGVQFTAAQNGVSTTLLSRWRRNSTFCGLA